jgi:excisionase family DNA binding protein
LEGTPVEPSGGEYLTPSEVAAILHVSPKTVTRWATEGRIPCIVTLGGHRRFRREDVEAIAERMAGGG